MRPRLLLGSTEPPAVGGSSTASLALFRRMLADGYDARYVPLIDQDEAAYYRLVAANAAATPAPAAASRIRPCWLRGALNHPHPELTALIDEVAPDVMVGFGFLATVLFTGASPSRPTVFVTGSCRQAQDHVASGRIQDAVALDRALADGVYRPRLVNGAERRAVQRASVVVTHSTQTFDFMKRFFLPSIGKLYPRVISFAEWIADDARGRQRYARPFDERDVDVLFIASDWDRRVKNYGMVEALTARLAGTSVHIVGDVPRMIRTATHHGFVPAREHLFALMGRARAVACPSTIDAAPGILYEASIMGCNVVASKNCGNWELCHPELLADPCTVEAFVACLGRARTAKYNDHLDRFLERRSYRELMALLTALPRPLYAEAR
jgi:glycosyltransferase involved in cell wall biosynthesis